MRVMWVDERSYCKNLFSSFEVGHDLIDVNLLKCANDILLFGDAILSHVNFHKSNFRTIGVEAKINEWSENLMNYKIPSLPFTYLDNWSKS
ncbi:hypothetical protein HKD37_19G052633 [Glycine soja]